MFHYIFIKWFDETIKGFQSDNDVQLNVNARDVLSALVKDDFLTFRKAFHELEITDVSNCWNIIKASYTSLLRRCSHEFN